MTTFFTKLATATALLLCTNQLHAQVNPINFETPGIGANWTWTTFENATNPPTQIVANPSTSGINTSSTAITMTTLVAGNPWAGFESLHGAGIGTFTLNSSNAIVKLMVYKSVLSDVGVKFATAAGASTGEIKVANTVINQWQELTFDFTGQIGNAVNTNIDQIIIFPDFKARTTDNVCYIDNIKFGAGTVTPPMQVKFAVQQPDSTPVYVVGNWNNWNNYPGTAMTYNTATQRYEATLPMTAGATIEYLFVNGIGTKEVLNPTWPCTNGNATYTNRKVTLGSADTTLCNVWATCNTCAPLGLNNIEASNLSVLFTNTSLQINSSVFKNVDAITVYDLQGKSVFTTSNNIPTNQSIALPLLPPNVYIVVIKKGNNTYKFKTTQQ